ncbi:MAG: PhzF family phenazine biosynthesis protein [Melioribacteraceae bacterium]|nr:PhzF family phenazine biosynthesis protein [Melioribacteraceae bacterium]
MKIYQVDSFTNEPFKGNPAGVCVLTKAPSEQWMKNVAKEMNLSETAFLFPQDDGYSLRWFTPVSEVDLCGHATLASAHILWEREFVPKNSQINFYTKSGLLTTVLKNGKIEMDFPASEIEESEPIKNMEDALGTNIISTYKTQFDLLLRVENQKILEDLNPNFDYLARVSDRGVIVTAKSDNEKYDFVSRFFAPTIGINEDPVTGSAHCALVVYWKNELGKTEFNACQISARGGELGVELVGDRVKIRGEAVTVLDCELL